MAAVRRDLVAHEQRHFNPSTFRHCQACAPDCTCDSAPQADQFLCQRVTGTGLVVPFLAVPAVGDRSRRDSTGSRLHARKPMITGVFYSTRRPEIARAITSCWISLVPSKIVWIVDSTEERKYNSAVSKSCRDELSQNASFCDGSWPCWPLPRRASPRLPLVVTPLTVCPFELPHPRSWHQTPGY